MDLKSSAISFFIFLGTLAKTFLATCTWQRWVLAFGNSSINTFSKPGSPSIIPKTILDLSRLRLFKSLNNSLHAGADSLSPACRERTILCPLTEIPLTTRTDTFSMLPDILISKLTPSRNRYLISSFNRSLVLHFSTASVKSLLALLISACDILRPIRCFEIMERLLVLIPARNITDRSFATASSYCLRFGRMDVLNVPFRSLGTLTSTSPMLFTVNLRGEYPFLWL